MECPKCHSHSVFHGGIDHDLRPPQEINLCLICSFEWNEANQADRLKAIEDRLAKSRHLKARQD